jgi:putative N6-adenine-specific DNA methylase
MQFRVTCHEGFEAFCADELVSLGAAIESKGKGAVTLSGPFELIYTLNRFGRTFDRVMVKIAGSSLGESDVVDELLSGCDFGLLGHVSGVTLDADEFVTRVRSRWITQLSSFIPRAFGARGGTRRARGRSDAYLYLCVEGETASLYADTSGDSLNIREYRVYNHPSSIRPTLAASLLLMAKPRGGVLYDPFCGGGTILIEASQMSRARPTHKGREYRYRGFVDFDAAAEEAAVPAKPVLPAFTSILGSEINSVHLKGCRKNMMTAGVQDVSVVLGDCTKTVLPSRADVLVTNPPFGVRGAKLNRMGLLYARFIDNLPNLLKEGGSAVVVTSDFEELKRLLGRKGIRPYGEARTLHSHLWVEGVAFTLGAR